MGSAFSVSFDVTKVDGLADKLSELGADAFADAALVAVNSAAQDVYDLVRPRMVKTLNLTQEYVAQRMQLKFGTDPGNIKAQIIAVGSKPAMTQLARYDARQLVKTALVPKRAKGNPKLGIPKGMKQAGVSVEVLRGSVKPIPNAFLVELRNGNGLGVATRTGKGRKDYRIRYGPSVYQMFKYAAEQVTDEASDLIAERLATEAARVLEQKLGSTK